jgi:hypothetical protein
MRGESRLGFGFNSPPGHERPESCRKDEITEAEAKRGLDFRSDRTCCVHAEQRALLDALEKMPELESIYDHFQGSVVYFGRLSDNGDLIPSGAPYCTVCSKLFADVGIGWCLWHEEEVWGQEGIYRYGPREYNEVSFCHYLPRPERRAKKDKENKKGE